MPLEGDELQATSQGLDFMPPLMCPQPVIYYYMPTHVPQMPMPFQMTYIPEKIINTTVPLPLCRSSSPLPSPTPPPPENTNDLIIYYL
jgi:hypothetical protein